MAHQAFLRISVAKSQRHVLRLKKERKGIFGGMRSWKFPVVGVGRVERYYIIYGLCAIWVIAKCCWCWIFLMMRKKSLRYTFLIFQKKLKVNDEEKRRWRIERKNTNAFDSNLTNNNTSFKIRHLRILEWMKGRQWQ